MKFEGKNEKTANSNLKLFFVIAASILFFFAVYRIDLLFAAIGKMISVLEPIIFGLVIAYLLNPLVDIFAKKVFAKLFKNGVSVRQEKFVNFMSVFLSVAIFCFIIWGIIILIIPGIIDGIGKLSATVPKKIMELIDKGDKYLDKNETTRIIADKATDYVQKWLKTDLSSFILKSVDYIFFGVLGVVNFLKNFAIGLLVSIYILYNKRRFGNQSRKILCALFKQKTVDSIIFVCKKSNSVFSGFIYGKILDSLIVGAICLVGITIMDMPYRILVATIICVTNIIPIFGPYIGAVPCTLLIGLSDPWKGLYFVIFIILLQTLDGNVLGPKILGGKTGIESFWVIFALLVGGGLFGVLGMILGVPMFAVIYYFVAIFINRLLKKKNMSTSSDDYAIEKFDVSDNEVISDEKE